MDIDGKWMLSLPNNEYWNASKLFDTKDEAINYATSLIEGYRKSKDHSEYYMIDDIIAGSDSSMPASVFKELVVAKVKSKQLIISPEYFLDFLEDTAMDEDMPEQTADVLCENIDITEKDPQAMGKLQELISNWMKDNQLDAAWFNIVEEDTFETC